MIKIMGKAENLLNKITKRNNRAVASPVTSVGDWILMDIPKPMIKCCRSIVQMRLCSFSFS